VKEIDTDRIPADVFDKMKAKAANRPAPIDNTELVRQFRAEGGGVMHMRPLRLAYQDGRTTRGVTVAFKKKGGRMEIATAIQHRSDCFSKKVGTKTAIEHFHAGKTITLPIHRDYPLESLQNALNCLI
jgi:hypothetical protein